MKYLIFFTACAIFWLPKETKAKETCMPPELSFCCPTKTSCYVALTFGYLTGFLRPRALPASEVLASNYINSTVVSGNSVVPFFNKMDSRAGCGGFSGGAYGGFLYRMCQCPVVLGGRLGFGISGCSGKTGYPVLVINGVNGAFVRDAYPFFGDVKVSDRGYIAASAQFGVAMDPGVIYVSLGWSSHFVSARIFDNNGVISSSLRSRSVGCIVPGIGARINLSKSFFLGVDLNAHFGGKAVYAESPLPFLQTTLRPRILEVLAVLGYQVPVCLPL